jgi:peptidyl-prolyl cis-trans isomerase A (cyclophilin A)
MIKLATLIVAVLAALPLGGCPPAEPPPDETQPTERGTLPTTAAAPATAAAGETVTLQASVQALPDSGTVFYDWFQTAGRGVPISAANQASASFVAPSLAEEQALSFMVTTHDDADAVGRASVTVLVSADSNADGSAAPSQAVANAGADQWALAGEEVTLDGTKSTGSGLTYEWRQVSGGPVTFAAPDAATTTFTAPPFEPNEANLVLIELTVTDATGRQVTDRTQVKVGDAALSDERVEISTSKGVINLQLDRQKAPITVGNFLWYIDDGFYVNTIFHRVVKDFVVQGGGFLAGMEAKKTRAPIINEADNGLSNVRGTIAMARTDAPDSATSQFFINVKDNIAGGDGKGDLDPGGTSPDGYAVFGKVISGMGVVDVIANLPTEGETPREDVFIMSARRLPAAQVTPIGH